MKVKVTQVWPTLCKPGPVLGNVDRSSKRTTAWDALLWCFEIFSRERFFFRYQKHKIFRNVRSLFVSSRNETGSPLSRGHCPSVSTCLLTHFSPVQLFVTLWIAACQAPLSMGILQARMLEWVAMPSSRGSSWPKDQTFVSFVSCVDRWGFCFCFFTTSATWEASSCSGASG